MLLIKTPATSGNVAVGFDTLSLALNIYNVFSFDESNSWDLSGFPEDLAGEDNLVLASYLAFSSKYITKQKVKKLKITLVKNDIPVSRGMGSSATCILAGVIAANHFNKLDKSFNECVEFSAQLEGHSDNVFACAYGGLTASVFLDDSSYYETFKVNSYYKFYLLIPDTKGSTKELRTVLPKKVSLDDAVYNLSRITFVPRLFEEINFPVLKQVLTDKLHQQYRYPFIPLYSDIQSLSERDDLIVCISGSGPSVLVISTKNIEKDLLNFKSVYKVKEVSVSEGLAQEVIE